MVKEKKKGVNVDRKVDLAPGERKFLAKAKLMFDHGRVKVKPGDIVILGPEDERQGVNIATLLRLGAIEPYEKEMPSEGVSNG